MSFTDAFQIQATRVAELPAVQLVEFVNRLIRSEGWRLGVPPDKLKTSLRIYDPDGGIDALTDTGEHEGYYLGRGEVAWQVKASWPGRSELKKELKKAAVQAAFARGAGYSLVVGDDKPSDTQRTREEILRQLAADSGSVGQARVLHAGQLAEWASSSPGALFELNPQVREYWRADQFLQREPLHGIQFEPDEPRAASIIAIQGALLDDQPSTYHVRILGPAGVGKTRLALEAVTAAGVADLTLYAPNVPVSREFFTWVAANDSVTSIVIIDECDEAQALMLEVLARQCQGRLRLMTVGTGHETGEDVYVLTPLDHEALRRVVRAAAPNLPDEQVRWIADQTRGFVKLAVAVARAVARRQMRIIDLHTDREIRYTISRIIAQDEDARRALRGIALLTRVGWRDQVSDEGKAIALLIGMDWNYMRQVLDPLRSQGLVVTKGRYWYVSPELLAMWLAAEYWEWHSDRIPEFIASLPLAARDSLLERLSQLGDLPGVQDLLSGLVGPGGPFRDLNSLNDSQLSRLFSTLANGAPEVALGTLERIIGSASLEQLQQFGMGRRDVIYTLERMLEWRETFFRAAELIRRLAEAENEHWANNATGVWNSIFLTGLGRTEVPAIERFALIADAIDVDRVGTRLLAVSGIGSALQSSEIGLPRGRQVDLPRPHWRPTTRGEIWEVKREALRLLDRLLDDPSPVVRQEARTTFVRSCRDLLRQALANEVVERLELLDGEDEAERRRIWEGILDLLRYEANALNDTQRERLDRASKRFYDDSLEGRIKRFIGSGTVLNWPDPPSAGDGPAEISRGLAEEAIAAPEQLCALLPWLSSDEAANVRPFGRRLGQLDEERAWFESLLRATREGTNPQLLGAYLAGRAAAGDGEWRESVLDTWAEDAELAQTLLDATLSGPMDDRAILRLIHVIDRGWLAPRVLGWLQYGTGMSQISADVLAAAASRLRNDDSQSSISAGLALIADWLEIEGSTLSEELRTRAWEFLESPEGWQRDTMMAWSWRRVAVRLVDQDPERMAHLVVRSYLEGEEDYSAKRLSVLEGAIAEDPAPIWEALGTSMLRDARSYRLAWVLLDAQFINRFPDVLIIGWVRRNGVEAAHLVAQLVKPTGERLPELVRFLLDEYRSEVDGTLAANFTSGSWTGSEATYVEAKLEVAEAWLQDDSPAVRHWAEQLVASLRHQLQRARITDDELW